ncbi:MAG: hypothetical protein KAH18_08745 [Psychromonas sp.]|nr:hypothetical protein [Psychromonas sp.]
MMKLNRCWAINQRLIYGFILGVKFANATGISGMVLNVCWSWAERILK